MNRHQIPAHLRSGSEEQSAVREVLQWGGAIVFSTSDTRVTRSTPGVPDLFAMFLGRRILLGWDAKAGTELYRPTDPRRLSVEQKRFGEMLQLPLTTDFGFGDAEAAKQYLMRGRT